MHVERKGAACLRGFLHRPADFLQDRGDQKEARVRVHDDKRNFTQRGRLAKFDLPAQGRTRAGDCVLESRFS